MRSNEHWKRKFLVVCKSNQNVLYYPNVYQLYESKPNTILLLLILFYYRFRIIQLIFVQYPLKPKIETYQFLRSLTYTLHTFRALHRSPFGDYFSAICPKLNKAHQFNVDEEGLPGHPVIFLNLNLLPLKFRIKFCKIF